MPSPALYLRGNRTIWYFYKLMSKKNLSSYAEVLSVNKIWCLDPAPNKQYKQLINNNLKNKHLNRCY